MSKPNKDGWIRHRGGKCPVDVGELVDVRYRDGTFGYKLEACRDYRFDTEHHSGWDAHFEYWDHDGMSGDIMAWRPHKPDIEALIQEGIDSADAGKLTPISEVRAKWVKAVTDKSSDVEMPAAKYFDGPLQWRDRIREIERYIDGQEKAHRMLMDAANEERASLVAKLKAEGFALIQSDEPNSKAESAQQDMSDPANWRVGDLVKSVNDEADDILIGGVYVLYEDPDVNQGDLYLVDRTGDKRNRCIDDYEFHSRPAS